MTPDLNCRIRVIDSHTAGEPTRVVISGTPMPIGKTIADKRAYLMAEMDWLRTAVACEPRGHAALVGALLCPPEHAECETGVIFFNNVGYLNGCIHGTIGVVQTLRHLNRVRPSSFKIDTPTGVVSISLSESGLVEAANVRSFRHLPNVRVELVGGGEVYGDIAWGGNWFFLTDAPKHLPLQSAYVEELTLYAWKIRTALREQEITGVDGSEIDHIELFGAPDDSLVADSKNFVLCPGKAYDRSPCGTGTSAKLACLYESGKLQPGERWRQAGILNTVFEGRVQPHPDGGVIPTICGSASITMEAEILIDPNDIFPWGIVNR